MKRAEYPVRERRLTDAEPDDYAAMTPAERVGMVSILTRDAFTFKDGHWDEPRLRRDVGRVVRRRG